MAIRKNHLTPEQMTELYGRIKQPNTTFVRQQGNNPINHDIVKKIFSGQVEGIETPDAYFNRTLEIYNKYLRAAGENLQNPVIRQTAGNGRFAHLKAANIFEALMGEENMDLSLVPLNVRNSIVEEYRNTSLMFNTIVKEVGLPGMSLPTTSAFTHYTKFFVDPRLSQQQVEAGEGIFPLLSNIMKNNFNPKKNSSILQDISIGRNRMKNVISEQQLFDRSKHFYSYNDKGELQQSFNHLALDKTKKHKIITWDTETTGLTPQSQIRDISLVERTVEMNAAGEWVTTATEPLMTKRFASDLMDIAGSIDNGKSIPLSEATILAELGPNADPAIIAKAKNAFKDGRTRCFR